MSYEYLAELVSTLTAKGPGPYIGTNENGESVTVYLSENPKYYKVETLQNNGVCRTNTYYKDGTVAEKYETVRWVR